MTDVVQMEIEAAQKLMKFAEQYKIPAAETKQTVNRLNELLKSQGK